MQSGFSDSQLPVDATALDLAVHELYAANIARVEEQVCFQTPSHITLAAQR
jgi:hypothetical protein